MRNWIDSELLINFQSASQLEWCSAALLGQGEGSGSGGAGGGEEGRAEAERLEYFLRLIRSSCSCDRRQNENKWPLSSTRRAALQIIFLQNPHDPPEGLCGAGGGVANIDPNADNIDTGIGIDRYHRNVIETIYTHTDTCAYVYICTYTNIHMCIHIIHPYTCI